MGVNLKDIVPHEPIGFESLKRKTIAIDAMNSLYQFLSSIRQPDGTPLMDSHGRITSHLSGLFYRTIKLIDMGIKPIYVFDGEPPELKMREIQRRKEAKEEAQIEWKRALKERRIDDAKKFAKRTSTFTEEMITESKRILSYMGIPYIQAPGEGEAQCVLICNREDAWAVGSQDYDSLLLGARRLIRGLTLSGKFELTSVELERVLNTLKITREQLIDIAILVGTDFNEGVKGIGPKKALKIVKENRISEIDVDFDIDAIRDIFLHPKVTDNYNIEWRMPDIDKIIDFLCNERDFSQERVEKASHNLISAMNELSQKDLSAWF